jgi:uncharacterized protein YkwD
MVEKLFIQTAAVRRAALVVTVLLTLILTACTGGAPTETTAATSTDTQVATASVSITEPPAANETSTAQPVDTSVTETSATLPTSTPTLGTPFPTNPPDCTNSASFVADVSIPDNTNIAGGTAFTKTWRISNTGSCVWNPTYTLVHYSDETLGAPPSVPLPITAPGQTADISVNLTAPNSVGTHRGNFVIENPAGLIMKVGDDSRLWVIINVTVTTAATVAATPTTAGTATSAAAVGSLTATTTSTSSTATSPSGSSSTTATCGFTIDRAKLAQVIDAVNAYRARNGRPAFTVNAQLAQAAQRHANDMACKNLFVHEGSDGSTPQTRVRDTGYVASSVSENVNGNKPPYNGQEVVNWWITDRTEASQGQNLLSTTFTEIGVGYSFFEDYGYYVVVFAKP